MDQRAASLILDHGTSCSLGTESAFLVIFFSHSRVVFHTLCSLSGNISRRIGTHTAPLELRRRSEAVSAIYNSNGTSVAIRQRGRQEEKGRERERCEGGEIGRDRGRKEGTGEKDGVIQQGQNGTLKRWLFGFSL